MIRHEDKCIQKEWIQGLGPVESLYGFPGRSGIVKYRNPFQGIGCHKHHVLVLEGVALEHAITLEARGPNGRSLFAGKFHV